MKGKLSKFVDAELSEEANPMFGSHLEIIHPQNKRVGQQNMLHKTHQNI